MKNSAGTYSKEWEEKIRNHDDSVGYMGIITDYLLFQKDDDYHLKLMITIWDYDRFTTEIMYLNYITTQGKEQFFRFCMNFCLLWEDENGSFTCFLENLPGSYCVMTYHHQKSADALPVELFYDDEPYYEVVDMWQNVDFIETFKEIEIPENHSCNNLVLSDYVSDVKSRHRTYLERAAYLGYRIGYIYFPHEGLKSPQNPRFTADVILNPPHYQKK